MRKIFIDTEFLEGTQTRRILGMNFGKTKPTIDIISIALVDDSGKEYYGISKEFNLKEAWNRHDLDYGHGDQRNYPPRRIYWIRENVLKPIFDKLGIEERSLQVKAHRLGTSIGKLYWGEFTYDNLKGLLRRYGKDLKKIRREINAFICPIEIASEHLAGLDYGFRDYIKENPPEFYGYYADYDWVVFCWLYGHMKDLPSGFPMYCHDLKQELDRIASTKDWYYGRDIWSNTRKPGDNDLQEGDQPASLQEKIDKIKRHDDYPKQNDEHDALSDARFNRDLYKFLQKMK